MSSCRYTFGYTFFICFLGTLTACFYFSFDKIIWNTNATDIKITLMPLTKTLPVTNLNKGTGNCPKRAPDVLITGASKCGTGALSTFLSYHPDIAVDAVAELKFFASNYESGFNWYLRHLPCSRPDQVVIERSADYFYKPEVPDRVWRMNPTTKMILCVCEPVRRIISEYVMKLAIKKLTDRNIEHYVFKKNKTLDKGWYILRQSNYSLHFGEWLRRFPLKQIHIVDSDALKVKPWQELTAIEHFLGIKKQYRQDSFIFNKKRGFFCYKRNEKDDLNCLPPGKGRAHPKVDENVITVLRQFYRPYNEIFFKLSRRRFNW